MAHSHSVFGLFVNLEPYLRENLSVKEDFLMLLLQKEVLELDDVETVEAADDLAKLELLQTKINDQTFPLFLECLRKSGQEDVAWQFEQPDLSVKMILESKSDRLYAHCKRYGLDIKKSDTESLRLMQIFLFGRLLKNRTLPPFHPPISVAEVCLAEHETRKRKLYNLIARVLEFVKSDGLQKTLQSKNDYFTEKREDQVSKGAIWMTKSYFNDAKSQIEGKPLLLVAGPTSAGKSTIVNALLGENVMPTDINVCSRVLCKVQYAQSKYAIVRAHGCESNHLCLDSKEDLDKFADYVKGKIPSEILSRLGADCSECEIDLYWPSPFLQNMVIVDSPGVSVNEAFEEAVKHFKDNRACGFLFVLDANRAAEEAAKVGGLITDNEKMEEKGLLMAKVATFIVNKWDSVVTYYKSDHSKVVGHLEIIKENISKHWKGFQRCQLIQFDAEFAGYCSRLERETEDMRRLCGAIKKKIPVGMTAQLFRGIRYPERSLGHFEEVLKEMLVVAQMTPEEKKDRLEGDWKNYHELMEDMSDDGRISCVKKTMEIHLDQLSKDLRQYLPSKKGLQKAWCLLHNCRERGSTCNFQRLLYDIIIESEAFKNFQEKIKRISAAAIRETIDFLKEVWERSPEANPFFVQTEIDYMLALAGQFHDVGPVMTLFLQLVFGKGSIFWTEYKPAVKKLCSESAESQKAFKRILSSISEETVGPFAVVYKEIPQQCSLLFAKISAKANKMKSDIPDIQSSLEKCQKLQNELSLLKMGLEFHDYDESEVIPDSQALAGMTEGSTTFHKAKTADYSVALLCTLETEITTKNALFFHRHLQVLQHYRKTESLLHYYGSVRVSKEPLKFGFVFEGFDKTLAKCLSSHEACSLQQMAQFAVSIASGVSYFHQKIKRSGGHGDLRLENILIVDGVAKLGPCTLFDPDTTADIRSLGVILWEIWNRKRLSTSLNLSAADFARRQSLGELQPGPLASLYPDIPDGLQQKWQDVIDGCLGPKSAAPDAPLVFSQMKEILNVLTL